MCILRPISCREINEDKDFNLPIKIKIKLCIIQINLV